MKFNDAVIGFFLFIFSTILLIHVKTFPSMPLSVYGPASFPNMLGLILLIASIILIIKGLRNRKTVPLLTAGEWSKMPVRLRRMILVPLTIIGYIYLSVYTGYIIYVFLTLALLLIDFNSGRWKFALIGSAVFTALTYIIFVNLLLVPLPKGIFNGIM